LLEYEGRPAVSIYMPRHLGGREVRQDPARLKNLLGAAEGKLADIGVRPDDAAPLLAPARALINEEGFWREQSHGLAVFLGSDGMRTLNLSFEPQEHVCAGERFHLFPLLRALGGDRAFLVLTISLHRARLYAASRDHIIPAPVELPGGVQSVASRTDYDGENTPEDYRKAEVIQYLREVSKAVEEYARREHLPVVLVALPQSQGNFRALGNHPDLLYLGISENPDAFDDQQLHRRALETIEPLFADTEKQVIERFNSMIGGNRISTEIDEIAEAAQVGRVDTLILSEECEAQLEDDLLDTALTCALRTGARAHVVQQMMMPERAPAAAIFRY
jgi:hypothetical protein